MMAGMFFVFTGWTESTFAAFLAVFTACYLLFRLMVERLRFFRRQVFLNLIALGGVALVGVLPLILAVAGDLVRNGNFLLNGPNRAEFLSADLLSFFIPSQFNPWLGFLSRDLTYHNMDYTFVGYATLLLAVIGIYSYRARADLKFMGVAALLFAVIMLGPVLHVGNQPLNFVPLPFALVQSIPLVGANRLPVRYDHLMMLAVAVLAGSGVFVVLARFKKYRVLFLLLPVLILAEHLGIPLSMSDLTAPAVYMKIAAEPGDFSILDLPLSWSSSTTIQGKLYTQSQFYQTVHHKLLLGGNTSRPPPFEFQYFNELPVIHSLILLENGGTVDDSTLAQDIQAAPELATFFDIRHVVAQQDMLAAGVLDYLGQVFPLKSISNDDGVHAYSLEPTTETSLTIDQSQALSRMYFGDDWGRAQSDGSGRGFRWSTYSGALIYAPLVPIDYQMCGLYAGAREGQKLSLSANNVPFGEIALTTAWTEHCVALPARDLHPGINSVVFDSDLFALDSATFPEDRDIGQTGVVAPKDIAVTSAGFLAGKFASLTFNGRETYATKRGFYLMAIDPRGLDSPSLQMFDTFRDDSESVRLADFVRRLPPGTIVAGAVSDDASVNLTQEAVEALETLGLSLDLRGHFRWSYAFIGVKGASAGAAVQASDPSFPANVHAGKDVTTPDIGFALGNVEFSPTAK